MGALADAVGYCVVLFTFVPVLAAVPRWLYFEATNPLNRLDAVVLASVPVRAVLVGLASFSEGLVQGVLAGVIHGVLVSVWLFLRGHAPPTRGHYVLGAVTGALAGFVMVVVMVTNGWLRGGEVALRATAVAFEIGSAAICGVVAIRTTVRLLLGARADGKSEETVDIGEVSARA